jgi:DNA-binding GntR family transcriptional regulator
VEAISDLPMIHDIDADYSPQYVKLARIIRDKIEAGEYECMDAVPAAGLAGAYGVSIEVAYAALAMLGANRYVSQVRGLKSYRVTWESRHSHLRAHG